MKNIDNMNEDYPILKYANDNQPQSEKDREARIKRAAKAYEKFMDALGIDWKNDPNSMDTPRRVAKSFINDLASGCYTNPPSITTFENTAKYDGIVFDGNIDVKSFCSHHHLPFIGKAHVAYIPSSTGKIIGLSKLNRAVEFFSRRPQVQESLTMQVHDFLNEIIEGNVGVAVVIEANHMCACVRGVKHDSTMMTSKMSGRFIADPATREEFYDFINRLKRI